MTDILNSQLGTIAIMSPPTAGGMNASQLGVIGVMAPPFAAGMEASQLGVIAVIANDKSFQPLGPPVDLGCWSPCNNHIFQN